MIKKTLMIIGITLIAHSSFAGDWQKNKHGLQYKVDGISEAELEKSKQAIELWQKQTTSLFAKLKELNIDYSELSYQQMPHEKITFGLIFNYDISTANKAGIPIVAVSPTSLMNKIGVRSGDIINAINGKSLSGNLKENAMGQWQTAADFSQVLRMLHDGDELSMKVQRGKQLLTLTGEVKSTKTPFITLSTATIDTGISNCSYLRSIPNPKPRQNLYSAEILSIDGERFNNRSTIKLAPGPHLVEIKEHIQSRKLSNSIQTKYRKKTQVLEVLEGRQYTVSALLKEEKARDKGNYWEISITSDSRKCTKD